MKNNNIIFLVIIVFFLSAHKLHACSIFCAVKKGEVLAAGNEDWSDPFSKIWIRPASAGNYGSINLGHSDYQIQAAINEHGLFFDFAYIPKVEGKNNINKTRFDGNLFSEILDHCKTVNEALAYLKKHQYESSTNQILLADATGNSVIVNQDIILGRDGSNYQIITNFNACEINTGNYDCKRFQIIDEGLSNTDSISIPLFRQLLSRTHQEGTHPTQYSYIFDLKRGNIKLYSFHNYEDAISLNVQKELSKGYYIQNLKDLFPITFEEEYFRLHHKDSLKQSVLKEIRSKGVEKGLAYYSTYKKKYPKAGSYPFVLWDIGADLVMNTWSKETSGKPFDYWWHPQKYLHWETKDISVNNALAVFNQLEEDIKGDDLRQYIGVYEMKAFIYRLLDNRDKSKQYLKKTLNVATEETGNYHRAKYILDNFE